MISRRFIVQAIRQAGARHVFVASAAPPIRYCNVYGIDMPTTRELFALDDLKKACQDAAICIE